MKKTLSFVTLSLVVSAAGLARAQDPLDPPAARTAPGGSGDRPAPKTVGIGIGMGIGGGTDLMQPNTASVRFVLTDMVVLEPMVDLSFTKQSNDPPVGAGTDASATNLGFGGKLRYKLASSGPVQLDGIGQLAFNHQSLDQATDSSSQQMNISWGLALSWYFNQWWALSLDATNTFFNLTRSSTETAAGDNVNTNYTVGAIWRPAALLMVHVFLN